MQRVPVVSGNLAEVGDDDGILEVAFRDGAVYQYFAVPVAVYEGLLAASSHGRYLDQFVKKAGYKYRRIA